MRLLLGRLRTVGLLAGTVTLAATGLVFALSAGGPGALDGSEPRSSYGDAPGELVPDLRWKAVDGRDGRLSDRLEGAEALVIVMRDARCPVARKYGHRLAEMERTWGERGVRFLYLNVNRSDDRDVVRREELGTYGFEGPYVLDPDGGSTAAGLRPRTTTEVFVLDTSRTLRYRGAVDDQFGLDFALPEPREHHLEDALGAVLAGDVVERSVTWPSGCVLEHAAAEVGAVEVTEGPLADRPVTWHGRVSRIVQENCVACHRDGGVAPFSLERYDDAFAYRQMLRFMVGEGLMPPWFAGEKSTGHFANARGLTDRERADLFAWIDAGAPEGDPDEATAPRRFAHGWNIGEPDAVVQLEEEVPIAADGYMDYRYVYVKTDFPEDRWIQRLEVMPTALEVTHHVLVFIEAPGAVPPQDAEPGDAVFQGGIDGFFAGYVPGSMGVTFPDGMAKRLPAGAWLKFQLHYTPNGRPQTDRTKVAMIFADGPPEREVRTESAFNARIRIPPGAPDHEEVATYTFREDGRLLTLFPHMHVRGKDFRYDLLYPDGTSETVLDVPRYDFNWQLFYRFAEPKRVPAGTVMRVTAHFDNSEANPFNPDPTAEVRFGEQTYDEMLIGYFDWVSDRADGA